jgi:DNA-directed RNA polymerase specialized sigma24 family protein
MDEYGPIDLEVYDAARDIWPAAQGFGEFALQDHDAAFNHMLNAAAKVTARLASGGEKIVNLKSYLFQTYKHLVGQEKANRIKREQPLDESDKSLVVDIVKALERKILLRELFRRMSEEERTLSQFIMFGYTYAEIAEKMETTPDALRSRFTRLKRKLDQIFTPSNPINTE